MHGESDFGTPELVDIHCHILPGVDDGARDMAEALAMARAAVSLGVSSLVATPHVGAAFPGVRVDELSERCNQLNSALSAASIDLLVLSGAEVTLSWALEASSADLRQATLSQGGKDLLVETPTVGASSLPALLPRLAALGLRITLAHPERSREMQRDRRILDALSEQGVVMAISAQSVLSGPIPTQTSKLADSILRRSQRVVLASDAHRAQQWRPVSHLRDAQNVVAERYGNDASIWMTSAMPSAVVSGSALAPRPSRQKSSWLRRLLPSR
jgi:protein-tyrosine phosphatase